MSDQPIPLHELPPQDPYVTEAITAEQDALNAATMAAQANYLLNRCIELSAELRRLKAQSTSEK